MDLARPDFHKRISSYASSNTCTANQLEKYGFIIKTGAYMTWPKTALDFKIAKDIEKSFSQGKRSNSGCMLLFVVFFCIISIPIFTAGCSLKPFTNQSLLEDSQADPVMAEYERVSRLHTRELEMETINLFIDYELPIILTELSEQTGLYDLTFVPPDRILPPRVDRENDNREVHSFQVMLRSFFVTIEVGHPVEATL